MGRRRLATQRLPAGWVMLILSAVGDEAASSAVGAWCVWVGDVGAAVDRSRLRVVRHGGPDGSVRSRHEPVATVQQRGPAVVDRLPG